MSERPAMQDPEFDTWRYHLVARFSEEQIEDMEPDQDTAWALRWIDDRQSNAIYECERNRMCSLLKVAREKADDQFYKRNPHLRRFPEEGFSNEEKLYAERMDRALTNYMAGRKSPDPEQRKRFEALSPFVDHLSTHEGLPILEVLERAKLRKGRPSGISKEDRARMGRIKALIRGGRKLSEALDDVVSDVDFQQSDVATRKRLEAHWRWKMSRRTVED